MNEQELKHWKTIREFELDDHSSALTFSDRLAKENGWSREYALRAIEEYKKFMFLICATNQSLTPSDEVDQVWHLHLLYTHSYWKEFCTLVLKREVHHGPTKGGIQERDKFTNWYSETLHHYLTKFNCHAPPDIWPPNERNFPARDFRRIDLKRNWIIKKLI
jgi:hypothetical protein